MTPQTLNLPGQYTLWHQGGLGGFHRTEVKDVRIEIKPFAQWENGIYITYKPKGARKSRSFVQSTFPSAVFLQGWGHNLDQDLWGETSERDGVQTSKGRFMSCDPAWREDFSKLLGTYLERKGLKLAFDARGHKVEPRTSPY